jgi:hypothetical protein
MNFGLTIMKHNNSMPNKKIKAAVNDFNAYFK